MAYSLGGYSGDLSLDETNQALTNSGSNFQLQQPEMGASAPGGSQFDALPSLGAQQAPVGAPGAMDMSGSGYASPPPQVAAQSPIAPPAPTDKAPPPEKRGGNSLGKVLGIVGGIMSGGVTGVLGAVGSASKK